MKKYQKFSSQNQKNTYTSSSSLLFGLSETSIKVLIFALLLMLAVVFTIFFIFTTDSCPAPTDNKGENQPPSIPVGSDNPYATVAKKDNYIADDSTSEYIGASLYSEKAVLIDVKNMKIIASKGSNDPIYPASMTKIMTVVVACDLITDLNDKYTVTKEILKKIPEGASTAWLEEGFTVTVEDLLYGISYRSGADSVICLIDYLGMTDADFVALMNEKAKVLGLEKTSFGGAIGMDSENNVTTCLEMSAILAYALDNPLCRDLLGGDKLHIVESCDLKYYHSTLVNTLDLMYTKPNKLVSGYTMLCAKSGYETKAGHCLASYTEDEKGNQYILVTANTDSKFNAIEDYKKIFRNYI